jgi:dihydroxyacetone kinase DhaKLM complex PTS-EIIA-like component DhaM
MTRQLNIASTESIIAYGTPEMAAAVADLVKSMPTDQSTVFSMLGHEDGVVAYGANIECVAQTMISLLALALKMNNGQ